MNRFNLKYINDLLNGTLTIEGYNHILSVIVYYSNYNNWPVNVIFPEKKFDDRWEKADYEELLHQYFEWLLIKNKLSYIQKVPEAYRSYYLLQLLMSFFSDKIAEHQKTTGVSYSSIKKIVLELLEEKFEKVNKDGKVYWADTLNIDESTIPPNLDDSIKNLPLVAITEKTKHLKPHVKNCLVSIFEVYQYWIEEELLISAVYKLFDQSNFHETQFQSQGVSVVQETDSIFRYKSLVDALVKDLTPEDCHLFLSYLFVDNPPSLDVLASTLKSPKSTLHFKISNFKKKITATYIPVNQEDGVLYIKNIHDALDKIANK